VLARLIDTLLARFGLHRRLPEISYHESVRRSLALARAEAARLAHHSVSCGEILLVFARPDLPEAGAVLRALDVDPVRWRAAIEEAGEPPGDGAARAVEELPYTSRAKRSLEHAMHEAMMASRRDVTPRDLLLGALAADRRYRQAILDGFGLTLQELRARLR